MNGKKTISGMIFGAAVFAMVLVASPKEAAADTVQQGCINAGAVAMKVAEFRDIGIPLELTVGQLVEAGLDSEVAVNMTIWIYTTPEADRATIGQWFYNFCMKQAGELL